MTQHTESVESPMAADELHAWMTREHLKAWMAREHWTIRSLAIYLDRNPATIQNWRNGTYPVPRYMVLIMNKETK